MKVKTWLKLKVKTLFKFERQTIWNKNLIKMLISLFFKFEFKHEFKVEFTNQIENLQLDFQCYYFKG